MKKDRTIFRSSVIYTVALVFVLTSTSFSLFSQYRHTHTVLFHPSQCYPEYSEWLQLDMFLKQLPDGKVSFKVEGHADVLGSHRSNDSISEARTQVVVRHLLEWGVNAEDIHFNHYGETRPIGDRGSTSGLSRRVELTAVVLDHPVSIDTGWMEHSGVMDNNCMVQPPFPAVKLPVERFSFNASEEQEIRVAGGSILFIPAMAFMKANGEVAKGKIDLTYEDFYDRADVFLSGIPMKYDSLGTVFPMESYGMFRIMVSNADGPLDLAPDKSIRMEFVSGSSSENINFYFLDSQKENWEYLGKAELIPISSPSDQGYAVSLAVSDYLNLTSAIQPIDDDTIDLLGRFNSHKHVGEAKIADHLRHLRDGTLREKRIYRKQMRDLPQFRIRVEPLRAGENRNWVKFTIVDMNLNGSANREWRTAFKSHVWQYNGPLRRSAFIQKFRDLSFQDLRIYLNESTNEVSLMLKNLNGTHTLPLMKTTCGELDVEMYRQVYGQMLDANTKRILAKKETQFEKRYHVYEAQLKLRERRLTKELQREHKQNAARLQRDLEWAWEEARLPMLPSELEMTMVQWELYCVQESLKQTRAKEIAHASRNSVIRKLEIRSCGIYNCNRLKDIVDPHSVKANFFSSGAVLNWYKAFVFDENLNSYLVHSSIESAELSLDPEALLGIIVIDMSGNQFHLCKEDVMAMNHGGRPLRIMNVEPLSATADVEDIRQLLSMGF